MGRRISHLTTWPGDCCLHATGCSLQNIYMSLGRSSHTSHGDIVQTILVTILGDPSPGQIAMLKESNFIYLVMIILSGKFHSHPSINLPSSCPYPADSACSAGCPAHGDHFQLRHVRCYLFSVRLGELMPSTSSVSNSKLFGASFFGAGTCGKIQRADIGDTRNTASWQVQLSSVFWGDKGLEFWLETIDDRGDGLFVLNIHEKIMIHWTLYLIFIDVPHLLCYHISIHFQHVPRSWCHQTCLKSPLTCGRSPCAISPTPQLFGAPSQIPFSKSLTE